MQIYEEINQMKQLISTQEEFENVAIQFNYSDYRDFTKRYKICPASILKLTVLDIDIAWTRESRRKEIMSAMRDNISVSEMNKKALEISNHAEEDADIFMALKKRYISLGTSYQ